LRLPGRMMPDPPHYSAMRYLRRIQPFRASSDGIPEWECSPHTTGRINTSAEMPRGSCRRRIIAIESPRFRFRTSTIGARANDLFQVSSREALLLHTELDGLDRIGRIHRIMLNLVRIDEGREHIQPVALGNLLSLQRRQCL
jgi:hypothetical protein